MIIQASFIFDSVPYVLSRPVNMLDRNHDDEGYAYFLERIPNTEDGLFEINIHKSGEDGGELIEKGYTSIYSSLDQVMPDGIVDTVIRFNYSNI